MNTNEMNPVDFARHLNSLKTPIEDIATLTGQTIAQVSEILGVKTKLARRAPVMGALLSKTPDPTTDFEERLKDAGKFAAIADVVASVRGMDALMNEAKTAGDYQAVYAIKLRVLTLSERAAMNKKPEAHAAFAGWLRRNL